MNDKDRAFVHGVKHLEEALTRKIKTTKRLHRKFNREVAMRLLDDSVEESIEWISIVYNTHGRKNPLKRGQRGEF